MGLVILWVAIGYLFGSMLLHASHRSFDWVQYEHQSPGISEKWWWRDCYFCWAFAALGPLSIIAVALTVMTPAGLGIKWLGTAPDSGRVLRT